MSQSNIPFNPFSVEQSLNPRFLAPPRKSARKYPNDDIGQIPHPSHRQASPSSPWPWVDLEDDVDRLQLESPLPPIPPLCNHEDCGGCYTGYPQSRFPNWTYTQVLKSKIYGAVFDYDREKTCTLHRVDIDNNGLFINPGPMIAPVGQEAAIWDQLIHQKRPDGIRVRAMFIEHMSGPILQMLGTQYNIEPVFWSSSLSWIPSRFQEELIPGIGDHITLTLTFLRSRPGFNAFNLKGAFLNSSLTLLGTQMINPHAPLTLYSNDRILMLDLLAVHLIRNKNGSTIISFHPSLNLPTTTASFLHERVRFAGQNVHWHSILQTSPDPTLVLLIFLWHAMYGWDEALEDLYDHICSLEDRIITTAEMPLTRELHIIRAHHIHYTTLLDDFEKHVIFIRDTHNPAMDSFSAEDRMYSKAIMERECMSLLAECKRLQSELYMQEGRLNNVMELEFSSVDITQSRYMMELTAAAIRNNAILRQIAYLLLVFLPASFIAGVFGMNVREIKPGAFGTLPIYFGVTIPLTIVTAWVLIASQGQYIFPMGTSFFRRLGWPVYLIMRMVKKKPAFSFVSDLDDDPVQSQHA